MHTRIACRSSSNAPNLLNMQRFAMLAESNMLYFGASLRLLLSDD
jgi:hypothetical protein